MGKNLVEIRDGAVIAAEINVIKDRTKREVLSASVEIGKRLCEAKELVPFGDWEQWLHDKVDYSQSTANNLMRIFKEYGDEQVDLFGGTKSQTFGNLSYSQAIALFALPADEREAFVQENPVEDMTARQLQDAIKAKEAAEQAKAEAENKLAGTEKLLKSSRDSKDKLEQALKSAQDTHTQAEASTKEEIQKLKDELAKLGANEPAPPSPAELKKIRAELKKKIEAEFQKKEEQLTLEKKTAEEKAAEIQKTYEERLKQQKLDNQSILERQQAAEKKLALSAPEAQKFSVHFESFQQSFNSMKALLDSLAGAGNTEVADKLRGALKTVLEQLAKEMEI